MDLWTPYLSQKYFTNIRKHLEVFSKNIMFVNMGIYIPNVLKTRALTCFFL